MSAHSSSDRRKPLDVDSTQSDARAHADRALRLPSTEVLCRAARGLGPAGESGHDAAPRSLRRAPALYDRGETAERHLARAAVGILPGRAIGGSDLRVSANVLLVAVDRARERPRSRHASHRRALPGHLPRRRHLRRQSHVKHRCQVPTVATAPAKVPTKTKVQQSSATKRPRTLGEELLDEARELQRSRSGRNRAPEQSGSWLTRLLGGSKPRPRSSLIVSIGRAAAWLPSSKLLLAAAPCADRAAANSTSASDRRTRRAELRRPHRSAPAQRG